MVKSTSVSVTPQRAPYIAPPPEQEVTASRKIQMLPTSFSHILEMQRSWVRIHPGLFDSDRGEKVFKSTALLSEAKQAMLRKGGAVGPSAIPANISLIPRNEMEPLIQTGCPLRIFLPI